MKEAPVVQDRHPEIKISHLFQRILPYTSEQLSMFEGPTKMQNVCLSFNADPDVPAISVGADCSTESFRYLAGYIAYGR